MEEKSFTVGDLVECLGHLGRVVAVKGVAIRVKWNDPALGEYDVFRSTIRHA